MPSSVLQFSRSLLFRLLPFVLLLLLWYALVEALHVPSRLMPTPVEVGRRIYVGLVSEGDMWTHLWQTLRSTLGGYLLGTVLAIAVGSVLAMNRKLELLFYPLILLMQSVPKVALAPLVLLWLGFNVRSAVALVALICFFPIFVGAFIGVRSTPPVLRDLFRTLGASGFKTFLHCNLPHASGSIIAGMQVGWGFALVGCVVMEFIMGSGGAGFLIDNSANALDTVTAVSSMVLLGVMGSLGGAVIAAVRHRVIFWEGRRRDE